MNLPRAPHRWAVTPGQAVAIQQRLAARILQLPLARPVRLVAGLDAAFSRDQRHCLAAVVLWDLRERQVLERRVARRPLTFPYIPGLLTFREAPALLAALRKLHQPPDILLCDGQGLAHPRRLGIASHLGLVADLPAVGCAKSRLVGEYREPGTRKGERSPLFYRDEIVGLVLRTRDGVRPVFVSVGHRIDLEGATKLVLACGGGCRLPEPTRLADQLAAQVKRGEFDG